MAGFKVTDPVVYKADPLLYGEMEVRAIRPTDKRVVCRVDPDDEQGSWEIFDPGELMLATEVKAAA